LLQPWKDRYAWASLAPQRHDVGLEQRTGHLVSHTGPGLLHSRCCRTGAGPMHIGDTRVSPGCAFE